MCSEFRARFGAEERSDRRLKDLLWLLRIFSGFGRRQRKLADSFQHVLFLRRKHALETGRVKNLLALIGRHLTQIANGSLHHSAAVRRKLSYLPEESASLLALF